VITFWSKESSAPLLQGRLDRHALVFNPWFCDSRGYPCFCRKAKQGYGGEVAKGFALRWSPVVSMDKEEIDSFLSGRLVARIATIGKDGIPNVNPVWYYWDGECLYIVMKQKRQMARNILNNPWCSVVIDIDDRIIWGMWENRARGVIITGRAVIHEPTDQITLSSGPFAGTHSVSQARRFLLKRYALTPELGALNMDPVCMKEMFDKGNNDPENLLYKEQDDVVIAKIKPEKLRAWDFSKAAPKDAIMQ
jgi:hypothetical protein